MNQILILLTMALQLLVAAHNPHVPQSLRDMAISTANMAINVADNAIKEAKQPVLGAQPSITPTTPPPPPAAPVMSPIASSTPLYTPTPTSTPLKARTCNPCYDPDYYVWEVIIPNPPKVMPIEEKAVIGELILSYRQVQTAEAAKNAGELYAPYGVYFINVLLKGESEDKKIITHSNGNPDSIEYLVKMTALDNSPLTQPNEYEQWLGLQGSPSDSNRTRHTDFRYVPQTAGKRIITFTSGTLLKSIEIEVK